MDVGLVERAQEGDRESFAAIARQVADRFLAVARRILRDPDLARDATQEALLSVWQDLPQLRDPARFEAWAYRILVRACYEEAGRRRRWAARLTVMRLGSEAIDEDGAEAVVDRDQLERAFARLSPEHRTVLVLHHYLDLPLDHVAEIAGIPVGTAHSRLHHAMRGLRAALDADLRPVSREVS